jgi:GT2 family glycosyltransferase
MIETFVIVPTFREKGKVEKLLHSFSHVTDGTIRLLVVNGNPGDETSSYLRQLHNSRILELPGAPNLFWSGLVNLGLEHILRQAEQPEFVILMNADIEFDTDILTPLIAKARATPNAQLAAVTIAGRKVVSSGVKVKSWPLMINRHPLAGTRPEHLPSDVLIPVDFLPTRCTLIPFAAIKRTGLVAEHDLPHYGGDNEYTNRLRKLGFTPFVFTGSQVRLDANNTGNSVFHKSLSLKARLKSLFSIKTNFNPVYRLRFVRLAYPWYAWPSAMCLSLLRSVLEVVLGGSAIKLLFRRKESGFAGL